MLLCTGKAEFFIHTDLGAQDMTEVAPLRNLTPGLCKQIETEMLQACTEVAARYGLVAERTGLQAIDLMWNLQFGVRVSIPLPDGSSLDPERILFEALAEEYGLSPNEFGRGFSTKRERFLVTGIDPRRPKYPISATRVPNGKDHKFTAENGALLLQAAMKDVSPYT